MTQRTTRSATALAIGASLLFASIQVSAASTRSVARTAPTYAFGVNSYIADHCEDPATWAARANKEVSDFKSLGANSIAFVFPLYTDSITSNNIYAKSVCGSKFVSPSPANLAVLISVAHTAGLHVLLRPSLDEASLKAQKSSYWKGVIAPTNIDLWFTNYITTLTPYLKMAQSNHVEDFAISTELSSLAHKSNWSAAISKAKSLFKGKLSFTASWAKTGNMTQWPNTQLGVDTYRPILTASSTWSPAQLLAGWDAVLKTIPILSISNTTIDEVGIAAQTGAYQIPAAGYFPISVYPFNQTIQVNWITTACAFMKEHQMKGIYFWGPLLAVNGGGLLTSPNPNQSGNLQPQAQTAIKNCFGVGKAPALSSLSPTNGKVAGGTAVTITGANFIGTFDVTFGGISASSFTVVSSTKIIAIAPKHPSGKIQVTVQSGAGKNPTSSKGLFTFH